MNVRSQPPQEQVVVKDIVGRTYDVGDYVAYPISRGSSTGMTVGLVTKISFKRPKDPDRKYGDWEDCPQEFAWKYTVSVKPLKSTGWYWEVDEEDGARPVTIQKVNNIVRVDAAYIEDAVREKQRKTLEKRREADQRALLAWAN